MGGENLYRHKDAVYFLTSENEWYKAAYYNPAGSDYFLYPTASSSVPTAVASGTDAGTAVYGNVAAVPAIVDSAGGLSPYGTMGQGGNVFEWNESAFGGSNNASFELRAIRGGMWGSTEGSLRSSFRDSMGPGFEESFVGFRVASLDAMPIVPEPGTWAAAALLASGAAFMRWRKRRGSNRT